MKFGQQAQSTCQATKKQIIILISIITTLILILSSVTIFKYISKKQQEKAIQELFQTHYNNKVSSFIEENKKYNEGEVDVIFIGDSLTEGYDLTKFYPELITLNRGIGGDTTFGLEKRLNESVYALKPKVVVMLIGANNMDSMFENYEAILIDLKENLPDSKIILLSLTAMGDNWGRKNNLAAFNNVKIKKLAEKYNYTFIDLFTPLLDVNTNEVYEGYTIDGGHFTEKGYEVVTSIVKPKILEELNK